VRLVYNWLREIVPVTNDVDTVAREISLRGFEVAGVEHGREPVIDFEITANRPDCLSHIGLAREASAIWGLPLQIPDMVARTNLTGIPGSGIRDRGSDLDARAEGR
jgi:phenylalanyl-tRNA synthetase beta chain